MNWRSHGCSGAGGACWWLGCAGARATAGVPTDQLKGAIERVGSKTLDEPGPRRARRGSPSGARAVRKIANEIFDFSEIAQALHGPALAGPLPTPSDDEFVGALRRPPRAAPTSRRSRRTAAEKILYTAETRENDICVVGTTDRHQERHRGARSTTGWSSAAERWLVYDVSIEGVQPGRPTTARSSTRSSRPPPTPSSSGA